MGSPVIDINQDGEERKQPFIMVANFADSAIPQFKEERNKDYIKYGADNLYPDYLTHLFNKSAKHNAIVTGKANYIFGNGYINGDMIVNRNNDSLNDITKKAVLDIEIYGGFRWELIYNYNQRISEIYHVDYSSLRKGKEGFYFKEIWEAFNRDEEIFIPAFNPSEPKGSQIFEYNEYRPGIKYYPLPGYIGCNNYIETDIEISKYYLSAIRNGMMPSKMIQFFKGEPTDEKKREIEKRFSNKFSGTENAGKFIMVFNNGTEKQVEISDLSATEIDKQFIELNKTTQQEIFSGHLVTSPMLFGIKTEGQLGGNTELKTAYALFQNTYSKPKAKALDKELNWLLSFSNFKGEYELQETDPIGLQFDVKDVIGSLPKTFVLKELGIPEDMWELPAITPQAASPVYNTPQNASQEMVNDNIKNLTGRQYQGVMRIVRQYDYGNGKLTRAQAVAMLKKGFGLDDDDIIAFLGEEPKPLALSFDNVKCPKCLNYFDYDKEPEAGMGYVKCPECGNVITQIELSQDTIIGMFDECGDSKNDFEILKSKKVSFSADEIEEDEKIYIQEAFKTYDVTATENKILELIKKDAKITVEVIAEVIGETKAFVESKIKTLIKRGYIESSIEKIGEDEIIKRNIPKSIDIDTPPPRKGTTNPTQIYIKYSYEGPQDDRNRPFCAKMMQLNRLYSRYDIEQISQRLGYSVFDRRGGFYTRKGTNDTTPYCRHTWKSNLVIKKGGSNVS